MTPVFQTACPICRSTSYSTVTSKNPEMKARFLTLSQKKYGGIMDEWFDQLDFKVCRCKQCWHFWHHSYPDQASLFEMYSAHTANKKVSVPSNLAFMDHELRALLALTELKTPTLLDFGSGKGFWSSHASKIGFSVTSYDPSPERNDSAGRFVHNLKDLQGHLFDAINLEQVLEHVPDPIALLKSVRPFCSKKTILRISVPNMTFFGLRKRDWSDFPYNGRMHPLSPFEHLHGFSLRSFKMTLNSAGLLFTPIHKVATVYGFSPSRLFSTRGTAQFRSPTL